jgi:hypothetical protein
LWRVPIEPETKNKCAGEGQQQITALLRHIWRPSHPSINWRSSKPRCEGKEWTILSPCDIYIGIMLSAISLLYAKQCLTH